MTWDEVITANGKAVAELLEQVEMPRHRKTITTIEREYMEALANGEQLRPITMDDVLKAKANAEARRIRRSKPKQVAPYIFIVPSKR